MKKKTRKLISMTEYNKIMDKIIKKKKSVEDTLIEMLDAASKYNIKESKKEIK